jgi:hypothetical protein
MSDSSGKLVISYTGNGSAEGDVNGFQIQPAPLVINAGSSGTNITISFMALSGLNYQVQYKTNLTDTAWISLGNAVSGSNAMQVVGDSTNGNNRFYRVIASANPLSAFSLLHTSGTSIVNSNGNVVQL